MIDSIFFDSGGCYGVALIGAIKALKKLDMLKNITSFKGCSVGSIFALLLVLEYTPEEIQGIVTDMDFKKIFAFSKIGLVKNGHYGNEEYIMNVLRTALKMKVDTNITFKQLYEKTGKLLEFNTACICDNKPVYFSHETHPNTRVILALQMSISIPYVYPLIEYKDKYYADGGLCQIPVHLYDEKTHLIFQFEPVDTHLKKDNFYIVKQLMQTIGKFVYDKDNIINIKIVGLHSLGTPTQEQKTKMITDGFMATWNHIVNAP
jgi:predicted acylesterase/phospholipase RssA